MWTGKKNQESKRPPKATRPTNREAEPRAGQREAKAMLHGLHDGDLMDGDEGIDDPPESS